MPKQLLSLLLLALTAPLSAQLNQVLSEWKQDKSLSGASYGFCVSDLKTGGVISEHNSAQLLVPASTLKIITTFAALDLLGSQFRYETKLYYNGDFNKTNGVLTGDLIIEGSGDPSLQSEYFAKENVTDTWAKALKQLGLKRVTGKIIADASAFERSIPGEWIWADIGNYFGAAPCGVSFMDNKFKLIYNSGANNSTASLSGTAPNYSTKAYEISSEVVSAGSEDEAYVYGDPFSFKKEVKGSIPPNKKAYEVEAALPDPALLCAEMLCASLEKNGILCNTSQAQSNYGKKISLPDKKPIYTHSSPPLEKLIYFTNLKSNNHYCQSFLLTLGKGKYIAGLEALKKFCKDRGFDAGSLMLSDGCGLSRNNAVSTSLLTGLLAKIAKDSLKFNIMKESFPSAGKTGSMANVGKGSFIEGNMRAKTGYIQRARAYSGYVTTRLGRQLAFSVIMNNYTCSAKEAKQKLEKFLVALAEL